MRVFLLVVLGSGACRPDDDVVSQDSGDTATTTAPSPRPVFDLVVQVVDLLPASSGTARSPAPGGLCATLVDASPLQDPHTWQVEGVTDAAGAATFTGIDRMPSPGFGFVIEDCDGATTEKVGLPTLTGVWRHAFEDVGDGGVATVRAYWIDRPTLDQLEQSATLAGYAGDLGLGSFVVGFALDGAGAPAPGVTVTADRGAPTILYLDDDATDGLFTTSDGEEPVPNVATTSVGGFVVMDAPFAEYRLAGDGAVVFEPVPLGGAARNALVLDLVGR